MAHQNFIDIIKNEFTFLENDGYQLRIEDRNVWYEKNTKKEGFRIGFSWTEYDCIWISGLTANKRFNIVEKLINPIINVDLINLYTIYISPNVDYIPESLNYTESNGKINFEISTYEESLLFVDFMKSFYDKTAKRFYEEYKNLENVNVWLDKNDINNHVNLITSAGNTMMLRKLILMKLNNDKKFEDLFFRYKDFLIKKKSENESPYVDMFNTFQQLIPFFEK